MKMGVTVMEDRDTLSVIGLKTEKPKTEGEEEEETKEGEEGEEKEEEQREHVIINSYGDHRIAMAFGILGAALGEVTIEGAECVNKTFPNFWEVIKSVGGELEIDAE
jgi:5-enolpyruvylshikimate-3-phosphate synthase